MSYKLYGLFPSILACMLIHASIVHWLEENSTSLSDELNFHAIYIAAWAVGITSLIKVNW